jgi:alpha-mannosidase
MPPLVKRMIAALMTGVFICAAAGGQTRKFYIANDDHTDYMWAADAAACRTAFLDMLDYYLDLAETTAGAESDFQNRFSCDGSYWIRTYEQNRTAAQFERLIGRIRSGHITVPMTLLNLCYGGMPAEAVLRSLYYAGRLERRYGLKFKLALAQENQALPYGLGSLWAGAGASFSWKGICGCSSRIPDAWNRPYDMYWWTGPDGSRLLMKWYSQIRQDGYGVGGYAEARRVPGIIEEAETSADFRGRVPYDIVGLFGYGGDDLISRTDTVVKAARSATTAAREVVCSNETDFFEDFRRIYGDSLPSLGASFGNEWDLLSASLAEVSGSVKRGVEKLRAAEALAALAALKDPAFMKARAVTRDEAWIDLGLYFEHAWTADGNVSRGARAAWERERAAGFLGYVDALWEDARKALGSRIRKEGVAKRYFVFNPLGWERNDFADLPFTGAGPVRVIDVAANREVPSQFIESPPGRALRVWADHVPSLGYKTYEVQNGAGQVFEGGPSAGPDTLENARYRIRLAPNGAIASLADKNRGDREFVRADGGLRINELGPGDGTLAVENAGPVSVTLKAVSGSPLVHTTAVTLFRDSERIDIRNEIGQNFADVFSWRFATSLDGAEVWHEEIGAVIKARTIDQGGAYYPRAMRWDWLTLGHFADLNGQGRGLTVSAPDNQFFKLGNSTVEQLDTTTPVISVLAGGQVDGQVYGIPGQGGDSYFLQRFALRTHDAFEAAASMRFALEHQNPFVAGEVGGGQDYPAASFSFLTVDDPRVLAWSVKPAEETAENRTVIRVWNMQDRPANAVLSFGDMAALAAERTTHIETPIEDAVLSDGALLAAPAAWQVATYAVRLDGQIPAGKGIGRKKIR